MGKKKKMGEPALILAARRVSSARLALSNMIDGALAAAFAAPAPCAAACGPPGGSACAHAGVRDAPFAGAPGGDAVPGAGWRRDFLVTFDYRGADGGASVGAMPVRMGAPFELPVPSRAPYSFGGWFDGEGGGGTEFRDGIWSHAGDVTLHAHWEGTPGLRFDDLGDGECEASAGPMGASGSVVVPEYHAGRKVSRIANGAFQNAGGMTSIHIPDTVSSIGSYAFFYCTGLESVRLPAGLESIGHRAFGVCTSLSGIDMPETLSSIGEYAFWYCHSLSRVSIPSRVAAIAPSTFMACPGLESVSLPAGLACIGGHAFYGCAGLSDICVPGGVKVVGGDAFKLCPSLTIRAQADGPAPGWDRCWNPDGRPALWGGGD